MRYAVISDIHGNLPALEAVLSDARKRGAAEHIIAGDYCLSGAYPGECIAAVRDTGSRYIIRGNEERYLENLIGRDQSGWTDGQMQISYWCFRNIGKEALSCLMSLPHTIDTEVNGTGVHIAHSSESFLGGREFALFGPAVIAEKYAEQSVTADTLRRDITAVLDRDESFQNRLNGLSEGVYIFGHSHVQWSYKAKDRNVYLLNPGSCGLPLDGIKDSVPYSLLGISESGEVTIEEIRVPFDKAAYAQTLKGTSQYREARVWTEVIIKELLTAREHLTFFLSYAEAYAQSIGDAVRPFTADTWERAFAAWEKGAAIK